MIYPILLPPEIVKILIIYIPLNVIPDARVRNIISKGPESKYRFPSYIDFSKCRREIAASLNDLVIVGANDKMLNLVP